MLSYRRQLNDEISSLEKAISNYDHFIKQGNFSEAIANSLRDAEKRIDVLKTERNYLAKQIENKVFIMPKALQDLGKADSRFQRNLEALISRKNYANSEVPGNTEVVCRFG